MSSELFVPGRKVLANDLELLNGYTILHIFIAMQHT